MFDVAIRNSIEAAAPSPGNLRALLRSTFDGEASRIRAASVFLWDTTVAEQRAPEYLCRLKLALIAEAPVRVVASSTDPAVAVTRAIQRAQSVLNGRRIAQIPPGPVHDHLAA